MSNNVLESANRKKKKAKSRKGQGTVKSRKDTPELREVKSELGVFCKMTRLNRALISNEGSRSIAGFNVPSLFIVVLQIQISVSSSNALNNDPSFLSMTIPEVVPSSSSCHCALVPCIC